MSSAEPDRMGHSTKNRHHSPREHLLLHEAPVWTGLHCQASALGFYGNMGIDMKIGGLILLTLGIAGLLPGQPKDGSRPAPSTVRGKEYPRIHSDRRVTFRVQAPLAKQVAVAGRAADSGMNGNTPTK